MSAESRSFFPPIDKQSLSPKQTSFTRKRSNGVLGPHHVLIRDSSGQFLGDPFQQLPYSPSYQKLQKNINANKFNITKNTQRNHSYQQSKDNEKFEFNNRSISLNQLNVQETPYFDDGGYYPLESDLRQWKKTPSLESQQAPLWDRQESYNFVYTKDSLKKLNYKKSRPDISDYQCQSSKVKINQVNRQKLQYVTHNAKSLGMKGRLSSIQHQNNSSSQLQTLFPDPSIKLLNSQLEESNERIQRILKRTPKKQPKLSYKKKEETDKPIEDKKEVEIKVEPEVVQPLEIDKKSVSSSSGAQSTDSLMARAQKSPQDIDLKNQIKKKKELDRRKKEAKAFMKQQEEKNRPRLNKDQAMQKIQYYQLQTELRAQERLEAQNRRREEALLVEQQQQNVDQQKPYVPDWAISDDSESEVWSENSGLRILDNHRKKYKYHLPHMKETGMSESSQINELKSMYSQQQNPTKLNYQKSTKNAKERMQAQTKLKVVEEGEIQNQGKEEIGKANTKDLKEKSELKQNEKQTEVTQIIISEAEMRKREEEEQLELLGESFLFEIQQMIQNLEPQSLDNGNIATTFSSLDSSQRSIRQNQLIDSAYTRKLLDDFEMMLNKQASFFRKVKQIDKPVLHSVQEWDEKLSYFNQCIRSQVLCFPILNRIQDNCLILQKKVLSSGITLAIKSVLTLVPNLLRQLVLDQNALSSQALQSLLQGLLKQDCFKSLTIQNNEICENSVELISQMIRRKRQHALEHLMIYKCKFQNINGIALPKPNIKEQPPHPLDLLLSKIAEQPCFLKSLCLVGVAISSFGFPQLLEFVKNAKYLTNLNLSWCSLLPKQMRKILLILKENRKLQFINLGWNNFMDPKTTGKEQNEIISCLTEQIKRNKQLLHLDLTNTCLSAKILEGVFLQMRRAGSILSIHFSQNPGLTPTNIQILDSKVNLRKKEDMVKFLAIQKQVNDYLEEWPNQLKAGIATKMSRFSEFQTQKNQIMDKFIIQRQIGFKEEQPGSAQWYESSDQAVGVQKHYKNDCWLCDNHIYSVLLWSRGRAFVLNPILGDSEVEKIRALIDEPQQNDDVGLGFTKGNLDYDQLDNRLPYLAASFTGWKYKKMIPMHEFTASLDKNYRSPFQIAFETDKIKKLVSSVDQLTDEMEIAKYKCVEAAERKRYRTQWARFFKNFLKYKQPYLINGEPFNHIDDEMDQALGSNIDQEMRRKINFNSEDEESESQNDSQQLEQIVQSQQDESQNQQSLNSGSLNTDRSKLVTDRPLNFNKVQQQIELPPIPPDESKWDIIYCLPFFGKPGKHQYLIKYKNTDERLQQKLLRKREQFKQDLRSGLGQHEQNSIKIQLQTIEKSLKPEVFFYNTQIISRTEHVPIMTKPRKVNQQERQFVFETSVFRQWKKETTKQRTESIVMDCKMWKLTKLFKGANNVEQEIQRCESLIMKNEKVLKELFLSLIANSSFPAITLNDLTNFVNQIQILDEKFKLTDSDRLFINANYTLPENPQFKTIGNALVRFEFWEILVRFSDLKYRQSGKATNFSSALEKLLNDNVLPLVKIHPWQKFRDEELWTIDCNDILDANLKSLQKIYNKYILSMKKYLSLTDVYEIINTVAGLEIPENELKFCFAMSKMAVTDEAKDYKKYNQMLFPEFLEFFGRLGEHRYSNSDDWNKPLAWKIEQLLEEVIPAFGLKKYGVNINVDEESMSDDDY